MTEVAISKRIASQLNISFRAVNNTIGLLEQGATIPFISRYRKEATGSLDEVAVSHIDGAWNDLRALIKRKQFVLDKINEQDQLTQELKKKIENCWDAVVIEDIYLPYKTKRKTKAFVAKENGLEPLAELIWNQRLYNPELEAKRYFGKKIRNTEDALNGARDILAERINENPEVRNRIRALFSRTAELTSKVVAKRKEEAGKYKDYFDYSEAAKKAPAHRILAVFRAENEKMLKVKIEVNAEDALFQIERLLIRRDASPACKTQLRLAIKDAYKRLLAPSIETEFRNYYKDKADDQAISVFAENLKQLLLAPPLGNKAVMGIDPGFRTGCKLVCLDENGLLVFNSTIYPHPPQNRVNEACAQIEQLVDKYKIEAISIGNGTAGKETLAILKSIPFEKPIDLFLVNENGASIYSASEIARKEFPDHDITVRGAVSIGRRLIDPLSELVKIDPKSIGVGQYQHDVNQVKLKERLTMVVEHCVNAVGINLNTASEHVLTFISGLGPVLARNIVAFRSENGSFNNIEQLKKVPRMGTKAYEQCAGFLRIRDGQNPLDNTAVHPERYKLVKAMADDLNTTVRELINNDALIQSISAVDYVNDQVGLPTISDILKELSRPGLDIRGKAKVFDFTAGINSISDLKPGMMVKGIINNVTKFGAFVDIGIKEAGLIHISQLSNTFVKDPMDVVKLNQEVEARVIDIDISRKRVSLSLKA